MVTDRHVLLPDCRSEFACGVAKGRVGPVVVQPLHGESVADAVHLADEVVGDYDASELVALADDPPAAIASRDEDVVALFGDGHLHAPVALGDGSGAGGQERPVDP